MSDATKDPQRSPVDRSEGDLHSARFSAVADLCICACVSKQLNEELKQNLRETMTQKYQQPSHEQITRAVDKLQQEVSVCTR